MKTKKTAPNTKTVPVKGTPAKPIQASFEKVVNLIEQARKLAYQAVNTRLINLYWTVGEYISRKIEADGWGKGTVKELSLSTLLRELPWSANLHILTRAKRILADLVDRGQIRLMGDGRGAFYVGMAEDGMKQTPNVQRLTSNAQ